MVETIFDSAAFFETINFPESISIDWSCKATPVITQGQCGSCYIIAPLKAITITMRIYNKIAFPMSIQ